MIDPSTGKKSHKRDGERRNAMRPSIATLLICGVLTHCVYCNSLCAVDDSENKEAPADQNGEAVRKSQSSENAVVRNVVYGLEEEQGRLYLTSQPLDGADRQLKRVELNFTIPQRAEIVEISLAKMDGKNLMAVVKLKVGEEFEFHCLTFIGPWGGGHVRERFAFHKAKFYTTRDELEILAVSGKRGAVFIVLGKTGLEDGDDFAIVTEGVLYSTPCPWPPSDGAPFSVPRQVGPAKGKLSRAILPLLPSGADPTAG
jgi:hypothetical protein